MSKHATLLLCHASIFPHFMNVVDNFQFHVRPAITRRAQVVSCVQKAPTVMSQVKRHVWTVQLILTPTVRDQSVWTSAMVSTSLCSQCGPVLW